MPSLARRAGNTFPAGRCFGACRQYPLPHGEFTPATRSTFPEAAVSVIETRELRKNYGSVEALKGVSIRVEPGEVYGLLGQNGAGKTTLIKILMGIVHKTDGNADLLGM